MRLGASEKIALSGSYLVIPDLQIPFEDNGAFAFVSYVKRHYSIPNENVLCVGDEVDQLNGGMYPRDPDGQFTATGEIRETKYKLEQWIAEFPIMRVCVSNHGMRWIRKASAAEIPSMMIRAYQDVLGIPETWRYADKWLINTRHPFVMTHGMEWGGKTPYRQAAETETISQVFGHLHSSAGICHVRTATKNVWGFNVGSLIDREAYAFKYGKYNKFKANNGVGVIANDGRMPIWIPFD